MLNSCQTVAPDYLQDISMMLNCITSWFCGVKATLKKKKNRTSSFMFDSIVEPYRPDPIP